MKYTVSLIICIFVMMMTYSISAMPEEPGAPSDLKVAAQENRLVLSWKASPDDPPLVTEYEIERAEAAAGPYELVGKVRAGVVNYREEAKPGMTHYYRVRSYSGKCAKNYSPYSNVATGRVPAQKPN